MTRPIIAPGFCQVAWVVKDIAAAEKFFVETMGVGRFMHVENLAAKDTEGTYLGKPGNCVCHLYLAYAGDTQIELIQPVSGESMYQESLDRNGDAVQHVAYFLDDSAYAAAAAHMESSGYPEIQSFRLRDRAGGLLRYAPGRRRRHRDRRSLRRRPPIPARSEVGELLNG